MILDDYTWNRDAHVGIYRNLWPGSDSEARIIATEFGYIHPASVETILRFHAVENKWPAKTSDFVFAARRLFKSRARSVCGDVFNLVTSTNGLEFPRYADIEDVFDRFGVAVAWGLLLSFDTISKARFLSSIPRFALSRSEGPTKREWVSRIVCAQSRHIYRKFYQEFIRNPDDVSTFVELYSRYGCESYSVGPITMGVLSGNIHVSDIPDSPLVNVGVRLPILQARSAAYALVG